MKAWWILLLLLPQASALPLYGVDTGDELVLSTLIDDLRATAAKDPGTAASADRVVWALRLDPALDAELRLNGTLNATAVFDDAAGGAAVTVTMRIEANGTVVAVGPPQNLTVIGGTQAIHWSLPIDTTLPAGPLWWNITAEGPLFFGLQLRVQAGETYIDLPDVAPVAGRTTLEQALLPGAIHVSEVGDGSDITTTYTWLRSESLAQIAWNVTRDAGDLSVAVYGADGANLFARSWDAPGVGAADLNGTTGEWRIVVERTGFVGGLRLTAATPEPEPEPLPPRARSTPLPFVVGVIALAIAWRQSPRSGD